jgi:hypothetical protein
LISARSAGGSGLPNERELDFLKGVINDRVTKKTWRGLSLSSVLHVDLGMNKPKSQKIRELHRLNLKTLCILRGIVYV